jgi:hypothetical protein
LALIKTGFVFDSIEYIEPLNLLNSRGKLGTYARVLEELISNRVNIDASLIQKALEAFFNQIEKKTGQG